MALSPWPTTPAALTSATATLKAAINAPDDATTQRLGAVAAAMTERYADGAPQAMKDESVIRFAGYLKQQPKGGVTKIDLANVNVEFNDNHAAMFRHCGAAALLSPWRVRRAGLIGGTTNG